jgi:DNA adenine methylase
MEEKDIILKKIIPLIPEHNLYCEPFAGGLSILFNKEKSNLEVVNDINSGLINFYRVMQDKDNAEILKEKLVWTPYSRKLYEELRNGWFLQESKLERAYQWFAVLLMSFGGKFNSGYRIQKSCQNNNTSIKFERMISRINYFNARLKNVFVECDDFRTIIKRYDTENTFFYLDPPYVHEKRSNNYYEDEMSNEDHEELINLLICAKGKILLSGYDNAIYDKLVEVGFKKNTI